MNEQGRVAELLQFLGRIDQDVPAEFDVHVVVDHSPTKKTPEIDRWLERKPRFHFHTAPSYQWWMRLVERWFFQLRLDTSIPGLASGINDWIEGWNEDPGSLIWH